MENTDDSDTMLPTGIVTDEAKIRRYVNVDSLIKDGATLNEVDKDFKNSFKNWRCDLRLGNEVYISSERAPRQLKKGEFVTIHPGDFVLLLTKEHLKLPANVMGFISMRFDYKEKGLINVSGFHVDPKYEGKLIFSAFNAGPKDIVLRESDPIFMIFFERMHFLEGEAPSKVKTGFEYIPAKMVEEIQGKSATLSANANRLDRIEFYMKVMGGIIIASGLSFIGFGIKALIGA